MSMRRGASVCQLFAVSSVPRAARTVRAGAMGASVMPRSHRTRHPATTDAAALASGIPDERVAGGCSRGRPEALSRARCRAPP